MAKRTSSTLKEEATIACEQAVIGAVLLGEQKVAERVVSELRPSDYIRPVHAVIHRAFCELVREHKLCDIVSVWERVRELGEQLDIDYLNRCIELADTAFEVGASIGHVRQASCERRLCAFLLGCADKIRNGSDCDVSRLSVELEELVQELAGRNGSLPTVPFDEVLATERIELEWLIYPLVPLEGLIVLSGDPGTGKSWVALDLAIACATGAHWLGWFKPRRRARVLYMDLENPETVLRQRCQKLWLGRIVRGADPELPDFLRFFVSSFRLDKSEDIGALERFVRTEKIELVILDPLIEALPPSANELDNVHMKEAIAPLRNLTRSAHCAVVLVDHLRKRSEVSNDPNQRLRGASAKLAIADGHLCIANRSGELIEIRHTKSNFAECAQGIAVRMYDTDDKQATIFEPWEKLGDVETAPQSLAHYWIKQLLRDNPQGLTRAQLLKFADERGITRNALDKALKEGTDEGWLVKVRGAHNQCRWILAKFATIQLEET